MCVREETVESTVNTSARIQPDSGTRVLTGTQPIFTMAMFPSVSPLRWGNLMGLLLFHGTVNAS
jgi:hypothetical protein